MIICGLKLTHDGSIAVIRENQLLFSIEMEKIANNKRYTSIEEASMIVDILADNGIDINEVDHFAVDGWGGFDQEALAVQPRLQIGEKVNKLSIANHGQEYHLDIAQYRERNLQQQVAEEWSFSGLKIAGESYDYISFLHVTGHLFSAYSTSPFAQNGESSYVLVWDGGMFPRLYYVDAQAREVENLGPIFMLIGNIYTIFSQHFGPFKVKGNFAKDDLSIAGKVMAYIAKGESRSELFELFHQIYREEYDKPMGFANHFANSFKSKIEGKGYPDEDILATFHDYLEQLLIAKLEKKLKRQQGKTKNLCLVGGCALNIKWNSGIRNNDIFDAVYVPPFPNDSGSAIGAAAALMFHKTGKLALDWDVYSGPDMLANPAGEGWVQRACTLQQLAKLLHEKNEPVVFLNGRAELGPRALGNRSILAAPVSSSMKQLLNHIKRREAYRPVSPICLASEAANIFEPGIIDRYMLFDHVVREEWLEKVPAICHLDQSARLQTVKSDQNPVIYELLTAYHELSGVPMLCNTSANYNGSGFFPDVQSAADWGRANYIWSDGLLYEKSDKTDFQQILTKAAEPVIV